MARTVCSEAWLAVYLRENSLSVSRALAAHVTAPLGRAARSRPKVSWDIFCSGRLLGCLEIYYGHKELGMERTTTNSLVLFQPFQPGRMKLRNTLSKYVFYSTVLSACVICTLPHLGILSCFYSSSFFVFFFEAHISRVAFFLLSSRGPGTLALDLPTLIL